MADRGTARLSDSYTEMTELVMPDDTNTLGRALGGVILHWMDICGGIAAMRFTHQRCVTASIDHVDFIAPISAGEVVTVQAYVFNTGRTSVDVTVEVTAENPQTGDVRDATASFLTFVALDEEFTPTEVPDLVCDSDSERADRDDAVERREARLAELLARMDRA
ncbi:MAG: acyl-CoA thioesterase [Haloarculaceae archaeon]